MKRKIPVLGWRGVIWTDTNISCMSLVIRSLGRHNIHYRCQQRSTRKNDGHIESKVHAENKGHAEELVCQLESRMLANITGEAQEGTFPSSNM